MNVMRRPESGLLLGAPLVACAGSGEGVGPGEGLALGFVLPEPVVDEVPEFSDSDTHASISRVA